MKLAFINFYSGYADRGGETYVDSLAKELSKKHDVYVFQAGPKNTKRPFKQRVIKTSYNPNHSHSRLLVKHPLKRLFIDYFSIKETLFTIKSLPSLYKVRPDIIFPQNSGWQVLILRAFSSLINARVIVAGQSGPGWNDKINLYVNPDIFVALTKTQAKWAKKATPWKNQKIVVIPNGVNLDEYSPRGTKRVIDLPEPIILAVAAAIKSKRIPDTIRAASKIKNASLLVLGTGPQETEEDMLGKSLLGNRYKRLKVSHSDMPSIYRSSKVFTLCSDSSEAFGIVYLEALASGLPCVVTDDSSRREILGKTGIYVKDPQDPKEYSNALKLALKKKTKSTQISQAERYSWTKIAQQYEKILDKK
jgi:glycosyltransferase involved in cell wall biosynthesis